MCVSNSIDRFVVSVVEGMGVSGGVWDDVIKKIVLFPFLRGGWNGGGIAEGV